MPNFSNVVDQSSDWRTIEIDIIKKEEGLSLQAYKDNLGFWTIGYGHHDSTINSSTPDWSLEQAEQVLEENFQDAEAAARRVCSSFDTLNGCRKGVIVQMVFQLGEAGVKKFVNTLRFIDEDDFDSAAQGMKNSLWGKQTPFRARRLAERMKTGAYA